MEEEYMKAENMRVLAVEALPDAVEFMCSGMLAALRGKKASSVRTGGEVV
jgi:LmbE family N-acetylglucosaminyl deacetylase